MEQIIGKDYKKSIGRSKNAIFKETNLINDECTYRVDQLKGNDGELPLFFSSSSLHLDNKVGDLKFDHKSKESEWPLSSQESGSWTSSFRFELDTQDDKRLQEMLKHDEETLAEEANLGQKFINCQSLKESRTIDGGSFRFIKNQELQSGNQYGHLKSPIQLDSFGCTSVFNANESQGYDIVAQPSGCLSNGPARIKVIMNDHVVASPRREVLRKLRDLKAHPLSPRFSSEDIASYQKEKDEIIVVKDDNQQRLKPLLKNEYLCKGSSKPISQYHCKPRASTLSELEIMEFKEKRRQSFSLPLELQESLQKTPQPPSSMQSTTLTLRFKDDKNKFHGVHSKTNRVPVSNINNPSLLDNIQSKRIEIPLMWEDKLGKPKTVAAAVDRVLARRLSRDGTEYMGLQLDLQKSDANFSVENEHYEKGIVPEASELNLLNSSNGDQRNGSHRYYGGDYLKGLSREASFRRSTRRYSTSEKEALIDLDGSAAAKFLVEAFGSPSGSHGSSPTFLVPFKWEDAPGKAKVETITQSPSNVLQLPPRLAIPSLSRPESFSSRKHRASASFGGFFLPCVAGSMPVHQKEFTSDYNLPPRLSSPSERLTRFGLANCCTSIPKEGCQIWISSSKTSNHISSKKSMTEAQLTLAQKCTNLSISELKTKTSEPSSPTNILYGPHKYNSQTSGSSIMFSSGDLDDFTSQTQKSASKSSSSTSCEYIEEDSVEFPEATTTKLVVDTRLLNTKEAPTSSAYVESKAKILTLEAMSTLQPKATNSSLEASPKRLSKLPYTTPSVAEQFLASCSTSGRRQFLQDLSPRLLHQLSGRRHSRRHSSTNIPYRHLILASHEKVVFPSQPYTSSAELFSSPINQQTSKALVSKPPPARPHRRIRLMSSIFKTLKRILGRKKRSLKRNEPMLMYLEDGKSPVANF